MSVLYGGLIHNKTESGDITVEREGSTTTINFHRVNHVTEPRKLSYVALLQLIARLNEAAKDAARSPR